MCINFNGYHSGGSSFLNDCWLKKKKKKSQYMVSHPETGSDSPIGSDRDRGCDTSSAQLDPNSRPTTPVLDPDLRSGSGLCDPSEKY